MRPIPDAAISEPHADLVCEREAVIHVDDASMGIHVTDVTDLAVASGEDEAVITFAISGKLGCDQDGCFAYHEIHGVRFNPHDLVTRPVTSDWLEAAARNLPAGADRRGLPASTAGISPTADASPFVLRGRPLILTQGHAGAAAMVEPGTDPPDTMYVIGSGFFQRSLKWFSGRYASQGFGEMGLAVGTGVERIESPGLIGPPSVRVFRLRLESPPVGELVEKAVDKSEVGAEPGAESGVSFDGPSVDISAEHAAIAYRRNERRAGAVKKIASRILLAWVDPETGRPLGPSKSVAEGDVGAPTVFLQGTAMYAVWAMRRGDAAYRLRYVRWEAGQPDPEYARDVSGPTESAFSPSAALVGGRIALAWVVGVGSATSGAIYSGLGADIEEAASRAVRRSPSDVSHALDPKWAVADHRVLLVWSEHERLSRIRLLACIAPG